MKIKKPFLTVAGMILYTALVAGVTYFLTLKQSENVLNQEQKHLQQQTASKDWLKEDYNWIPLPDLDLNAPGETYDIQSLTVEAANRIDLRSLSGHDVRINGNDVSDKASYELEIDTIAEDHFIAVTVDGKDFYIRTLPEGLQGYRIENNGAEDGYYYFSYGNYIVKLDTNGHVVYYKDVGTEKSYDFKVNETEEGKIYYSYLVQTNRQEKIEGIGYETTKAVIMDENYQVVDEVDSILPTDLVQRTPIESHEFIFFDLGHYIVSAYYPERVYNIPSEMKQNEFGTKVIASYLQEIKDNQVIWEWKSTEHPELYALSIEHNDFTNVHSNFADYMHFNALAVDPKDNNFVLSFRNLDALIKLDRKNGEIIWILGGKGDQFGLSEEQQFHRQHKVSILSDGSILLFNNGNLLPVAPYPIVAEDDPIRNEKAETTIVKMKIDEDHLKLVEYESFPTGRFSATRGSVQMLDEDKNIVLIGWGSGENNDEHFTEVNLNSGEKLFIFYPHDEDLISYRAYKFDK